MKKQPEMEFFDSDDKPFLVRYDLDRGEDQWFDAKAGVGSPGYPPECCVTEVNFGNGWESPETYPQLNLEAIEVEIMERTAADEADYWAAAAEAEYEAWIDNKRGQP